MIYQYVVTLKRNNDRQIDFLNILLCLISVLCFGYEQLRLQRVDFFFSFAILVIIAGLILLPLYARKKNKPVRYGYLLLAIGMFWIKMPYLEWLSVLFFLLCVLEYQAKYPLEVGFTDKQVVINSLIKRRFDWSQFNNIVLKDGLLTLDFKNNRLFQKEALDDEEGDADEDEFNDYCSRQLALAPFS